MTAHQADEWDEQRADQIGQNGNTGEHYAHPMSAPPPADPEVMALANKMMSKRIDDLEADIKKQRTLLDSKIDLIADLEDQLAEKGAEGRLALLLIDSADLTEIEELTGGWEKRDAEAAAIAHIEKGHAARAVVVRIMGEAVRQVEWKAAA
jgi:hypothetical protein